MDNLVENRKIETSKTGVGRLAMQSKYWAKCQIVFLEIIKIMSGRKLEEAKDRFDYDITQEE